MEAYITALAAELARHAADMIELYKAASASTIGG